MERETEMGARPKLKLYALLERLPLRLSYSAKVLAVAFLGMGFPLIALSIWLLAGHPNLSSLVVFFFVLSSTTLTSCITLWAIWQLLGPIRMLNGFLNRYVQTGEIADLPSGYRDEVGALMRNTRNTVVRLDRSVRELDAASKIDVLTGLYNRRFSSQRLQQDLARSNRSQTPVSLVVIDLDDFKELNDRYGHTVGDACLQHFARIAQMCIREGDWLARWGGDEFLMMLWDADSRMAQSVIGRIRANLLESEMTQEAGIHLTASFGFATHFPGQLDGELFAKADAALYNAKRLGKNRIFVAGSRG